MKHIDLFSGIGGQRYRPSSSNRDNETSNPPYRTKGMKKHECANCDTMIDENESICSPECKEELARDHIKGEQYDHESIS
jgi:hypothetical protein